MTEGNKEKGGNERNERGKKEKGGNEKK